MEGIILQGITLDQLVDKIREVVKEEITGSNEVRVLTVAEAARELGVSRPTLYRRMEREGLKQVFNTDLHKLQK